MADDPLHHSFPRGQPCRFALWLGVLLALTIAVRVYEPTGWLGSDDAAYYSAAEHILTGTTITRQHHHYARLAVILPVAASVAAFGQQTWAVALPMFVASILCVILVVVLGRWLFGWREGLLAGLVVSLVPYFRVLSTTAYADTHVCLWATACVLLFVLGSRNPRPSANVLMFVASGFALGLAISAKIFAITTLFALIALSLSRHGLSRNVLRDLAGIGLGAAAFALFEGLFFSHFAGDFFFSLHAHEQTQSNVPAMAAQNGPTPFVYLLWDRWSLPFRVTSSGWGWVGAAFWPAIVLCLFRGGIAGCMAIWAAASYLLIAFAPIGGLATYHPYPHFHGRHILQVCIPFALCLAFVVNGLVRRMRIIHSIVPLSNWLWPAAAVAVLALSFANQKELKGFCDRPTGRVGEAIREIIARTSWEQAKTIHMTPSMYWRFGILFPDPLRSRIRVSVSEDSPDWWKDVTPDIASRLSPIPDLELAYVLATPTQLQGRPEWWDYGVSLPWPSRDQRGPAESLAIRRGTDGSYAVCGWPSQEAVTLLLGRNLKGIPTDSENGNRMIANRR